jgi:hypothetical protein
LKRDGVEAGMAPEDQAWGARMAVLGNNINLLQRR